MGVTVDFQKTRFSAFIVGASVFRLSGLIGIEQVKIKKNDLKSLFLVCFQG
jgi:hypothetical protein